MATSIIFPEKDTHREFVIQDNESKMAVIGTKRINLFLGANNSRKSRFLRGLVKAEIITSIPDDIFCNFIELRDRISDYNQNTQDPSEYGSLQIRYQRDEISLNGIPERYRILFPIIQSSFNRSIQFNHYLFHPNFRNN